MSKNTLNPGLKMALDLGPVPAFFVGYFVLKDRVFTFGETEYSGFISVTAIFVPVLALSTYVLYRLEGQVSKMQAMTLILVVVFGGLTVWLNDERFIKTAPYEFVQDCQADKEEHQTTCHNHPSLRRHR